MRSLKKKAFIHQILHLLDGDVDLFIFVINSFALYALLGARLYLCSNGFDVIPLLGTDGCICVFVLSFFKYISTLMFPKVFNTVLKDSATYSNKVFCGTLFLYFDIPVFGEVYITIGNTILKFSL